MIRLIRHIRGSLLHLQKAASNTPGKRNAAQPFRFFRVFRGSLPPTEDQHMQTVSIPGATLSVEIRGSGKPILFVHGFPLDHSMWQHQIDEFSKSHLVIAPDLRGFGKSTATPGTTSMRQFADDLAAMLDALKVSEPVVYCGLSMGGSIGWMFAQQHRNRLRGLIVCDARAAADTPEAAKGRAALAERVLKEGTGFIPETSLSRLFAATTFKEQPATIEATRTVILATNPLGVVGGALGLGSRPDVTDWLPQLDLPTLLIVGTDDQISTVAEMHSIADAIPGARFVEVAGAGHMAPLEMPQTVNTEVAKFLKTLPG
jgi:3-oxoadipate enol-lactonase